MTLDRPTLSVGATVWVFDPNRRIYRRDKNGRSYGSPIWIEHWVEYKITGENRNSWLLEDDLRLQKGGAPWAGDVLLTRADVEVAAWRYDNALPISKMVLLSDTATLRKVAELIGYKEQE